MAVNKVIYGGTTLIDLTGDTVTADKLAKGYTAHDAAGNLITGTMEENVVEVVYDSGDFSASQANNSEQTRATWTVETAGVYLLVARGYFPTGTGGQYRFMAIKYGTNGTETELTSQTTSPQGGAGPRLSCAGVATLSAGQKVTLRMNQNSGGAVNVTGHMWAIRIE